MNNPANIVDTIKNGFFSHHAWLFVVLVYSSSLLLLLSPLLFNSVDPKWDALDFFFPAFSYLSDSIREGRLPLWDPFTNCGYPYHADPSNFTLNPLALLFGAIFDSPSRGLNWFWVCNWWWGGLGMIWLARHFRAAPSGAFVSAISYVLSGFFLAHAEHISFIVVAAWVPWIVVCAERAVIRSSVAYALFAGAALGFCSYGGYPGLILFTCFALALWLLLRFIPQSSCDELGSRPLSDRALWVVITLALIATIFILIWSPLLNAFISEGHGYTERVNQLTVERATTREPFTFYAAISLFFPYVTFTGRQWMETDISMSNAYMGMLTIPLALFWMYKAGARRSWWLLFFVLFMFVVSLGGKYGLRTLIYYLYPPTRYMQYNAPFRLFWIFPLCLAAGLGLTYIIDHLEQRKIMFRVLLSWFIAACAVAAVFCTLSIRHATPYTHDLYRLFAPGVTILLLGCAFMWYLIGNKTVRATRSAPLIFALIMLIDMSVHLYNNSGTVWDPLQTTKNIELYQQHSTFTQGNPPARIVGRPFGYLNAQQILKVPLTQGYLTMLSDSFDNVLCQSRFAEVLSSPHRFWLSPGVETSPSKEFTLARLVTVGSGVPVPVILEQPSDGFGAGPVVPGSYGAANVKTFAPEKIEIEVVVPGTHGAFLASTERFTPGWKVLVDGVPQRVHKTNLFFRGVYVPSGQHSVEWRYEPDSWWLLVSLSYLTLMGAVTVGSILLLRNGRLHKESVLPG